MYSICTYDLHVLEEIIYMYYIFMTTRRAWGNWFQSKTADKLETMWLKYQFCSFAWWVSVNCEIIIVDNYAMCSKYNERTLNGNNCNKTERKPSEMNVFFRLLNL